MLRCSDIAFQGTSLHLLRVAPFCLLAALAGTFPAGAASCHVAAAHTPSAAEQAFLHADYTKAAELYSKALAAHSGDPALSAALSEVLLRQQKPDQAAAMLEPLLAKHPHSAILETALGEAEYRNGQPWKAQPLVNAAIADDPCYPRAWLLAAEYLRLTSMYKSAQDEIETAYKLDSFDPEIRRAWISTLPIDRRIAELKRYIASDNGDDAEDRHHEEMYLDDLEKRRDEPHKSCRLVSETSSTEIPFINLMRDGTHVRAFGLEVKLNNKASRLQIDTGASGIYISRSVAEHAGLKPLSHAESEGVGSHGPQSGYTAYADSIRIGSLEFRDCIVEVSDRRNVADGDGLIGMDVFSRFLVGLDYPMRKVTLSPLPPRPGEDATPRPELKTGDVAETEAAATAAEPSAPAADEKSHETPSAGRSASASIVTAAHPGGPHNRYVAPSMRSYTPVYRAGHLLLLPVSLNGSTQKLFVLDTGAFTTTISPDAARAVTKVHKGSNFEVHGVSGKVEEVFTANKVIVQFANLKQQVDDILAFDTSTVSRNAGTEVSGLLGFTTLYMLNMQIDYRDGLVSFEYDKRRGFNQ